MMKQNLIIYSFKRMIEQKPGWKSMTHHGQAACSDKPALYFTFDEADQYCHRVGKRLLKES